MEGIPASVPLLFLRDISETLRPTAAYSISQTKFHVSEKA
jgi:hypothetical protein